MSAVSFQSISKTYQTPKGAFQALNHVSLDIEEGEFFGLLGPNGAGKTTMISILAGLSRATSGRVLVQGSDRSEEHTSELQSPCNLVCRLLLEKKKKRCCWQSREARQASSPVCACPPARVSGRVRPAGPLAARQFPLGAFWALSLLHVDCWVST